MRSLASLIGLITLIATASFAQEAKTDSVVTKLPPHRPDNHGHALHGTVDSVNLVSIEEMAKLGVDSARKLYAGKIVTFLSDFAPVGVRAKNERKKNVCMQGFGKWFNPNIGAFRRGGVSVYFNYGDEIRDWFKNDIHNPADLVLENPLQLSEDVCDSARICNYGDGERRCIFTSDRLLISGKIIAIGTEGKGRGFIVSIRPTGLRY